MGFDELEWVREVVDRWLSANGPWLVLLLGIVGYAILRTSS